MQAFGGWLAEQLAERGWASTDLGRISQVDSTNITRWIAEGRRPTPANLAKIAPALGVPYEDLMKRCGYLPGEPSGGHDPDETEMLALFRQVPDEQRTAAKMMLRGLSVQPTRPKANRRQVAEANRARAERRELERRNGPGPDLGASQRESPCYARFLALFNPLRPLLAPS